MRKNEVNENKKESLKHILHSLAFSNVFHFRPSRRACGLQHNRTMDEQNINKYNYRNKTKIKDRRKLLYNVQIFLHGVTRTMHHNHQ
jgi:hypothetical protein